MEQRAPAMSRRTALGAGMASLALPAFAAPGSKAIRLIPAQTAWSPPPPQAPATEGMAQLPDVKLWWWDTGGPGETVVLMHPRTGSAAVWAYQQPVLAAAGYRVIAYSRRGYYRSEAGPKDRPGLTIDDLNGVLAERGVRRFHLVGAAAGAYACADYALSHPERLISMTIASSIGGYTDPAFVQITAGLNGGGFLGMTPAMRELGPSYRAGYPEGVRAWEEIQKTASHTPVDQKPANALTWDAIAGIRTPTLLMTGDADMFMPPSRLRQAAAHFRNAEVVQLAECGHASEWEQPIAFNRVLLDFLKRHRA